MAAWKKRKWDSVSSEDYEKEVPKKLTTKPESTERTEIPLNDPRYRKSAYVTLLWASHVVQVLETLFLGMCLQRTSN